MKSNGIVRYDLQQGQQSVVQAHPEEPKEPGIGSRLFSAFAQEAPKLMETGIKAYEAYDKNRKEQQKAINQAEFYKMSVELKDQIDATKMQPAEVRANINNLYTTGLGMGLSYADIGNAFAGSGIDTNQKFIKDLMQSEVDVQRDYQKAYEETAAITFGGITSDPVKQQELLSQSLANEENIQILKNTIKKIEPNSQLDFTKANYNVAMTSFVNSAYANAYSQSQANFNTNTIRQVSQVVRQQLAEEGFSPATIEYYVRNRETAWKSIAKTNETNTEAAQKAIANDTQLFLDTSLQSLLQQEITVDKDTYQLGTAIALAKVAPEVGKVIFSDASLKDPFFKSVLSGSKIELPKTLDASAIKLTLGVNSMITQNIQDTGSEPLKDLSEEALKTFLKGQSGEGSSKSAAGLSMAAYRNATGNLQKKDFAGREETEADTFSHASKAISSDIEAINPGKDYVMLFDDDGTPRLYQTHLEKQLEISENMAYALEPGLAVPQYTGGKRGYAFEDVSNESFFTREYAGSAVQFLQDAATRTGKSKKELIYEFNSSMMKNSKAAKDLYKYLTDKDTAPTDDWATTKVAEARKGENKNLSQIISEENVERALEENQYAKDVNRRQLEDLPEDSEDAVITTDTADFVVPSVEESGSTETSSAFDVNKEIPKEYVKGFEMTSTLEAGGKDMLQFVYPSENKAAVYIDSKGILTVGAGVNVEKQKDLQDLINAQMPAGKTWKDLKKELIEKNKNKQGRFSDVLLDRALVDKRSKDIYIEQVEKLQTNKLTKTFMNSSYVPQDIKDLIVDMRYNAGNIGEEFPKKLDKFEEYFRNNNVKGIREAKDTILKQYLYKTTKGRNDKGAFLVLGEIPPVPKKKTFQNIPPVPKQRPSGLQ